MFDNLKSRKTTGFDDLIAEVTLEMRQHEADSEEFETMLARLERIQKVKDADRPTPLSRDTLALIVANLAGIGIIIGYERAHVITSKALAFVPKLR